MSDILSLLFETKSQARQAKAGTVGVPLPAPRDQGAKDGPQDPRTVRDTVTLTHGGNKVVNLARGNELAREIRARPVDQGFRAALGRALEDIFRITRLFAATMKALFSRFR